MDSKSIIYTPSGVCSRSIEVHTQGDSITKVLISGGCAGNTQAVAALTKGMKISEVMARLKGINCKGKGTSCPDQLCKALEQLAKQ